MRLVKIYSDGSYFKDELLTEEVLPNNPSERLKRSIGLPGLVVHGGIVIINDAEEILMCSRVNCTMPQFVKSESAGGEVIAAVTAMTWANGYLKMMNDRFGYDDSKIIVYHDYMGVSEWIKPHGSVQWKARSEMAKIYVRKVNMEFADSRCGLSFVKVRGHSGDKWNTVADCVAGAKYCSVIEDIDKEVINL